ncbi:hypothetical protein RJ641_010142 [Dillenia turbinata]|uniref:Uncharacterized protein n=1 Tax=Dillenia turbinata TaxID=194707 RepID=A0AAN8Z417_9MAGN
MRRNEKQRQFHEALVRMLYPPPPSPPQNQEVNQQVNDLRERLIVHGTPSVDDLEDGGSSSSGEEDGRCDSNKLTRSQRKRLRKKKLKEASAQRRRFIGPLLPSSASTDNQSNLNNEESPYVRQNASEKLPNITDYDTPGASDLAEVDESGGTIATCFKNKAKHRRMAKKLAKDRLQSSVVEKKTDQGSSCCNNQQS